MRADRDIPTLRPLRRSARSEALLTAAVLATLAASTAAQRQFDELHPTFPYCFAEGVTAGDIDGDGDIDLVFYGTQDLTVLCLNVGDGIYVDGTAGRLPRLSFAAAATLTDVDGDGDLDLVVGKASGQNQLLLNNGSGTFTDVTATHLPTAYDQTRAITAGDVDGDGDLDLIIANEPRYGSSPPSIELYLNDGSGRFQDVTAARMPAVHPITRDLALGDVDGDGDLDIVCADIGDAATNNYFKQNLLLLNDGTGHFSDATAQLPIDFDHTQAIALGDVDGDGDLDLVLANAAQGLVGRYGEQNRLYLNDGSGHFSDATAASLPATQDVTFGIALGDVDGDGDVDMALAQAPTSASSQNRLLLNDGSGHFSDATAKAPAMKPYNFGVALADLDGDGDLDWVDANFGTASAVYFNDGGGTFLDLDQPRLPTDDDGSAAVALGDVDGDGDLDLVFGDRGKPSDTNKLYLNNGEGTYSDVTATQLPTSTSIAVAMGDVDGDGDLDLMTGDYTVDSLYLNDGTGTFTDATATKMPVSTDRTQRLGMADVDGDGDLDAVLGKLQSAKLLRNDGTGTFADAPGAIPMPSAGATDLALGDLDGDGDPDLVLTGTQANNRLYLNDGTGGFSDRTVSSLPPTLTSSAAVAFGDVDGDGDLDIVFGNRGSQDRLDLNDGTARFVDGTSGHMPVDLDDTGEVRLADLDDDGDLDLLLTDQTYGKNNRLDLNDGTGTFTDVTASRMPGRIGIATDVALGDVDGDGDNDIVFANLPEPRGTTQDQLLLNLVRQLDAPRPLGVGRTFELDAYAVYGPPGSGTAQAFLAPATAHIPLPPLGIVGIDPSHVIALRPFAVPQPAGMGSTSFKVPVLPALIGAPLYTQAVLVDGSGQARLTNVTRDVVLP